MNEMKQHKQVTVDFSNYSKGSYDLALPIYLPLRILIPLVVESLDLDVRYMKTQAKVMTKHQLLLENDCLADYQVADGDILKIL